MLHKCLFASLFSNVLMAMCLCEILVYKIIIIWCCENLNIIHNTYVHIDDIDHNIIWECEQAWAYELIGTTHFACHQSNFILSFAESPAKTFIDAYGIMRHGMKDWECRQMGEREREIVRSYWKYSWWYMMSYWRYNNNRFHRKRLNFR